MSEQMDQLNKMKQKVNKDCSQIHSEIGDVRGATDEVARSKVMTQTSNKITLNIYRLRRRRITKIWLTA